MPELIMCVSRSADNRLSGSLRFRQGTEVHHFSGTLELMRVFEDLVPFVPDGALPASTGAAGRPAQPEASQSPNPKTP
jgi:hypothetical protein